MLARPASLLFAGDLIFSNYVQRRFTKGDMPQLLVGVQPILRGADITVVNLEGCLSTRGQAANKEYTFRAPPYWAPVLRKSGIRICTLANNHAMDYGAPALIDTLRYLREAGIHPLGAGRNWAEATSPLLIGAQGTLFALFAFTDVVPRGFMALEDRPGVSALRDFGALRWREAVQKKMQLLASSGTIRIAVVHWGEEGKFEPSKKQRQRARELIDLGFDAVIGHHPHVIQGIEVRNGKLVAYSLGNFVHTPRSVWGRRSVLLLLYAQPGGLLGGQLIPIGIDGGAPRTAKPQEAHEILNTIRRLSHNLGTSIDRGGQFHMRK